MNAAPWSEYHAHAAGHRVTLDRLGGTYTLKRFREFIDRENGAISYPTEGNPMQSAPYVAFGLYRLTGDETPYDGAAHVVATYCEGDVTVERYLTAEAAQRALWLLERAL